MPTDVIKYLLLFAIFCVLAALLKGKTKKKQPQQIKEVPKVQLAQDQPLGEDIDYTSGYKSKWMFTYNEKDAFKKIKEITDELGLSLFAKVRLFDLVEPKPGIENRQAHQWKIQAKHVDFVVCDKKLVARMIIELDDASHDTQAGTERDTFVDAVLQSCGYKVIRIRAVELDNLKSILKFHFAPEAAKL